MTALENAQIDFDAALEVHRAAVAKIPTRFRSKEFATTATAASVHACGLKLVQLTEESVQKNLKPALALAASWQALSDGLPAMRSTLQQWERLAAKGR